MKTPYNTKYDNRVLMVAAYKAIANSSKIKVLKEKKNQCCDF